jgi:quinol monooxygenase YgiN
MSNLMTHPLIALSLLLSLSVPSLAQPNPPAAMRSKQAEIIYLYRMKSLKSQSQQDFNSIQQLRTAMQQQHPDSSVLFFKDLTDDDHYISLITNQDTSGSQQAGWSKAFLGQFTKDFPGARSFIMESTLLIGDNKLNASPSSLIAIEHVDSDPSKRQNNLPLFQSLESRLRQTPGFKDIQIWTWNNRINHWTVIEVWDKAEDRHRANNDPELIRIWDAIYGNAAAPNSQSEYQLLK